jgi:hypothetical protein
MSNPSKTFSVIAIINGETYNKRTDDVQETLLSLKPELVLTEMYVKVKKGKAIAERKLTAKQARFLFNDEVFRAVFMNNLLIV